MFSFPTRQILLAADALELWLSEHRELLVAAILGLLMFAVSGCATLERCDIKQYEQTAPVASHGKVTLVWALEQQFPGRQFGSTYCNAGTCIVSLSGTPTFENHCSLARLGHEVAEAMGARHAP